MTKDTPTEAKQPTAEPAGLPPRRPNAPLRPSSARPWSTGSAPAPKILINDRAQAEALKGFRARAVSPAPKIGIAVQGGNVILTFTGSLQAADALTGPWADLTVASPYTNAASGAPKFFRSKR